MMAYPSRRLAPPALPTMYFVGVTTTQSSIVNVFPKWSQILGLGAELVGCDVPIHAPAPAYRAVVEHIRDHPLAMGALVTTHKIDLFEATRDLFDWMDPYAELCGEVSCISKGDGRLEGHAKDPISSGKAWQSFVPPGHWAATGADVMCIGAGGAAVAISVHVCKLLNPADRPTRFIAIDRSQHRLDELRSVYSSLDTDVILECYCHADPIKNDELMATLAQGSMVINATGMGKDRPGSPITDDGLFPLYGLVWELNYRGALIFYEQAQRQATDRNLTVEDGWCYFVHGWGDAIGEVFHLDLPSDLLSEMDAAAAQVRA